MKNTVVYHSADFDGIFCREIARKFLPRDTDFIGWSHGDPKVICPMEGRIFLLDLSPDCLDQIPTAFLVSAFLGNGACAIIWIDHHTTSIEKWPASIEGYRIDGVAACRLTWQWFQTGEVAGQMRIRRSTR